MLTLTRKAGQKIRIGEDIEIVSHQSGQPRVVLGGECLRIAQELGIASWHVSISHIETHATASAIGLRNS